MLTVAPSIIRRSDVLMALSAKTDTTFARLGEKRIVAVERISATIPTVKIAIVK